MKKKESVVKMVTVLTVTCMVAGICLSFTFNQTKDAIANAEMMARLASVKEVLPPFDGEPEEKTVLIEGEEQLFYIGKKDGEIVGVATSADAVGYGGSLYVLVGMKVNGEICGMALLAHQETPGLGTKAGEEKFLTQFFGKTLAALEDACKVKNDGGDIDAVTAATISSRAVCEAATKALRIFMQHKDEVV